MVQNKNILTLDRISKKDKSETSKEVSDVLLLLQTNESQPEIEMLKKIGLDNHIAAAEKVQNNMQRFTVLEQKFNRNVYSGNQIKEYCGKNGYRIIRCDKFNHAIPMIVGEKVIEFAKEHTKTHKRNEDSSFEKVDIELKESHFFLLISIQSINGAPIKAATLFYRETYKHDNYGYAHEEDMFIEVHSWGIPGNDKNLFTDYFKATDYFLGMPLIFFLIGALIVLFGENCHGVLLFLTIISIVSVILINKKSFFKWN